MNRRLLAVAVSAAAIVALVLAAVPAFAGDTVAPTFDRKASAGALAKAKRALRQARQARRVARRAGIRAGGAQAKANAAMALAEEDRSQLNGTRDQLQSTQAALAALKKQVDASKVPDIPKIASATAPGLVTSSAVFGEYEALGGPSVQVTVPSSGLIEVWAQVAVEGDDGGAVGLFEDGQRVTGISEPEICGDAEPGGIQDGSALIDMQGGAPAGQFIAVATPPTPGFALGCASAGAPAPVLLSRPAGPHTYELRYSECSCSLGGGAEFRDRVLHVAPRP